MRRAGGPGAGLAGLIAAAPGENRQRLFQNHQHEQAAREHFEPDKARLQEGAFGPLEEGPAEREAEAQAARQFMGVIVRPPPGDDDKAAQGVGKAEHGIDHATGPGGGGKRRGKRSGIADACWSGAMARCGTDRRLRANQPPGPPQGLAGGAGRTIHPRWSWGPRPAPVESLADRSAGRRFGPALLCRAMTGRRGGASLRNFGRNRRESP